jgi:hypothetical protein
MRICLQISGKFNLRRYIMIRAHIRGEEFVNMYRPVILQVASELLAHGSLYGTHVRDLVEEHEAGSTYKRNARWAGQM